MLCIIRAIVPHKIKQKQKQKQKQKNKKTKKKTKKRKRKKKKKKTSNCFIVMWTSFITIYIGRIDAGGLFQQKTYFA